MQQCNNTEQKMCKIRTTQIPCAVVMRASPTVGSCCPPSNNSVHDSTVVAPALVPVAAGKGGPSWIVTLSGIPRSKPRGCVVDGLSTAVALAVVAFKDSRHSRRPPTSIPPNRKSSAIRDVLSITGIRSAQPALLLSSSTSTVLRAALSTKAMFRPVGNAFRSSVHGQTRVRQLGA